MCFGVKKVAAWLLVGCLSFNLAACGKSEEEKQRDARIAASKAMSKMFTGKTPEK